MDPEIRTEKVVTQNKTFLVDLKKNHAGFYLKISEWSNSKKSSIFIPAEGLDKMIEVLSDLKKTMLQQEGPDAKENDIV